MSDLYQMTDIELLHLLGQGDAGAFRVVFLKYNRQLYAAAYNKLRDREEAKDAVQDVFAKLWSKASGISLRNADLSSYLHSAVRHRILDMLSKKKSAGNYLEKLQDYLERSEEHTDCLVRERQMKEIIEKEIAVLPPRMREAFVLSRHGHLSHKEIAQQMNITDQTVTDQVKKALKILKERLSYYLLIVILLNIF